MRVGAAPAVPPADEDRERWLPLVVVLVSLLPLGRAALPGLTYYFRDFTVTFYPLRLFWARELRAGRWPWWDPYVYGGAPALPVLYPPDLLHALFSGPAAVSWLLTLHVPLAALASYALARELRLDRRSALVAGSVFSLGGVCLSTLNLYVLLQALAWSPLVALGLRRAAARGGRWVSLGALWLAVSLSTLAVEFVAQAVLLGALLAWAERPGMRHLGRLLAALGLGCGLAALPVTLTWSVLRESVRGAGFAREVALGNEVHPLTLLQAIVPGLFGAPLEPLFGWWGSAFFTKGYPYLLSLYVGPIALAFAAAGPPAATRRLRTALAVAALLGLWYALGARAGLAALLAQVPGWSWFRFPSKALLLPHLALSLFAGLGASRLRRGVGWPAFAVGAASAAGIALAIAAAATFFSGAVGRWAALPPAATAAILKLVALDAVRTAAVALVGVAIAVAVMRRRLAPRHALLGAATVLVIDLARAGAGLNPQVSPVLFQPLPEIALLRLDQLGGGRVFSYGLDQSPAFRRFMGAGQPGLALWSFFLSRQMLVPYACALDRVETAFGKDLTSFVLRASDVSPEQHDPARVAEIVPLLKEAAVSRVLSLDALAHPDLHLLASVPAGPAGLVIQVYELQGAASRAELACPAAGPANAAGIALMTSPTACARGSVTPRQWRLGEDLYDVESAGDAYLLTRDSFSKGWSATVDGHPAEVLRANDRYRAVALGAGRHRVGFRYRVPGLAAAISMTVLSALVCLAGLGIPSRVAPT